MDCVEVKGASKAVVFYELLGPHADIEADTQAFADVTSEAFAAYRSRDFVNAERAFERALTLRPEDTSCAMLAARCRTYASSPPPEDWSGALRLTTKR